MDSSFRPARGEGYGLTAIVKYDNGYEVIFAHRSKLDVRKSCPVVKGTKIGYCSNTGNSDGPYLHYELGLMEEWLVLYLLMPILTFG